MERIKELTHDTEPFIYFYVIPGLHRSLEGHRDHGGTWRTNALSSLHFLFIIFWCLLVEYILPGGLNPTQSCMVKKSATLRNIRQQIYRLTMSVIGCQSVVKSCLVGLSLSSSSFRKILSHYRWEKCYGVVLLGVDTCNFVIKARKFWLFYFSRNLKKLRWFSRKS